jgi:hydrophobic/amphiphilic exporter-1 (mainly G- bacteria), HAE1 family
MNISSTFILRPVMTTLLMSALIIFGVISYFQLPVSDLPSVDFPSIMVQATLPGASADTMAAAVATPLEKQFSTIAGLESMNSTSAMGNTTITLQFALDRKIDGAALDVQSAISAARNQLPTDMPTPPIIRKVNPADAPILYIALSCPSLPLYKVDDYAETILAQSMSMVAGVAQVQVFGSQIYAVHVQVNPEKLSVLGIGIDDVANSIRSSNVNLPTGTLYGPYKAYVVQAHGQLYDASAYRPIIVTYRNGSPIRLHEIANVIDSVQMDKVASWFTNTRAVILAVQKQPGTNTIQVVDEIRKLLPQYIAVMPPSVNVNILYDRSISIRNSVNDVQLTFLVTLVLVILVIYAFLGDIRATIIASLALPVSIFGTLAIIQLLHYSLDNLSLMALTLSTGFVVDDAIVMLENIVRHREHGEDPLQAALRGSKEIGFTILSMTLSLVAVFIPILFLPGVIGKLFQEFGVTISVSILLSGVIALTFTPMLCSRFLRTAEEHEQSLVHKISEAGFKVGLGWYRVSLRYALKYRIFILICFIAMVIGSGVVFHLMPKGFLPSEDTGQIFGMTEAAQGISFEDMARHQKAVADIVAADPNVAGFMSSIGAGGPNSSGNGGRIFIVLKPKSQRKLKVDAVIDVLRKKTSAVPGIKLYLQNLGSIKLGGQLTKALYQFSLSSPDTATLYASSIKLEEKLKQQPELIDVNSDLQVTNPQVTVEVDRDKCSQLGITMNQLEDALDSAYASRQVSTIYAPDNEFWVILEVEPQFYSLPSLLHRLYLHTPKGQLVPLDTVARLVPSVGPLLVNHLGQFPSVTLSFNLKGDTALNQAMEKVKQIAKETLPDTITPSFQGNAQMFESSQGTMGILFFIAVTVIYIVLGILYESYIHPITILSGLPSAMLGALVCLWLCKVELTIYAFLGLILLIGIVKKNAIMIIDFALEAERSEKLPPEDAIFKACVVRFRPIMMTTMAALMGSIPIAIGIGSGSEARQPLGLTVVGGLLGSQIVTLYITPVFYLYLEQLKAFCKRTAARLIHKSPAAGLSNANLSGPNLSQEH